MTRLALLIASLIFFQGRLRAEFVFSADQITTTAPAPTGVYSFGIFLSSTTGTVDITGYQFDLDLFQLAGQAGEDSFLSFDFSVDGQISATSFGTSTSSTNLGIANGNFFPANTLHSIGDSPTLLGTLNIDIVNSFTGELSFPFDADANGTEIQLAGGGTATGSELVFLAGPSITAIPEPSSVAMLLAFGGAVAVSYRRPRSRRADRVLFASPK